MNSNTWFSLRADVVTVNRLIGRDIMKAFWPNPNCTATVYIILDTVNNVGKCIAFYTPADRSLHLPQRSQSLSLIPRIPLYPKSRGL